MPEKTFHNLPNSKKNLILDVCFEEFALNNYEKASVSRIVKKLGIAKGSIYQYFKNKKELYLFLIDVATQKRLEHVQELFAAHPRSFKDFLVENFMEKVAFDKKYPVIGGFLFTVLKERFSDDMGNMEVANKARILKYTKQVLEKYVEGKHLRSDLDLDLMAYAVIQMQIGVYDFFELKYGVDYRKNIRNKMPVIELSQTTIKSTMEQVSEIIIHGLIRRK